MNCDQAIELLPWLLNGTLEGEDRKEVQRHLETCERCRKALAETREAWSLFTQHLSSQDLVALAWGGPPLVVDSQTAEEHLASCPQCAAELELAGMSRRLEEEDNVAPFPVARTRRENGTGVRTWRAAAIAAGLTAFVASGGWIHELRLANGPAPQPAQAAVPASGSPSAQPSAADGDLKKKFDEMAGTLQQLQERDKANEEQARNAEAQLAELQNQRESPHASTVLILDTPSVVRNSEASETPAPKEIHSSGLPSAVLLQALKDEHGATGRKAEIVDDSGKRLHVQDVLTPNDLGYYALSLPAGFLKPGRRYTIQLSDAKNGQKREQFVISVK